MHEQSTEFSPDIRRLRAVDAPNLLAHFLRLDSDTRRLRFGAFVDDLRLQRYVESIRWADTVIYGAFFDRTLRGVGELHGFLGVWPASAEAALSVETNWQTAGLGEALLHRLIRAAQNRGVRKITMLCLRENERMQRLARKHAAFLTFEMGDVQARVDPPFPTPFSLMVEMLGNTNSYLHAVFDVDQ